MSHSLLIIDDHAAVADAMAQLAATDGWLEVHTATTFSEGLAATARHRPNVVTVDLGLGDEDGYELLIKLRDLYPHVPLVVVTATGSIEQAIRCLRVGAAGFVPKSVSSQELLNAIRAVDAGDRWVPTSLVASILEVMFDPQPINEWEQLYSTLSRREAEVLALMAVGLGRRQVADRLHISLNTARTHAKNIHTKLGVHTSGEAVSIALRAGVRLDPIPDDDQGL
ncbi:MAG: response regulator transcription factor [Aquihabitans sp.]